MSNCLLSDLNALLPLTSLIALFLYETQTDDISGLSAFPNLYKFSLGVRGSSKEPPKSVDGFEALASLSKLTDLSLRAIDIKDLSVIPALPLKKLRLSSMKIGDYFALRELSTLKSVSFYKSDISDFSSLRNNLYLEELDLTKTEVRNLSAISHFPFLKHLNIHNAIIFNLNPLSVALPNMKIRGLRNTRLANVLKVQKSNRSQPSNDEIIEIVSGRTAHSFDPGHGNQVEYNGRDGDSYL